MPIAVQGSLEITAENLQTILRGAPFDAVAWNREIKKSMLDVTAWIAGRYQGRIPEKSGKTRAAVRHSLKHTVDGWEGRVFTSGVRAKRILRYLEEGTGIFGPHSTPITPKTTKVLRFRIGDKLVFARSVKGQRAAQPAQRTVDEDFVAASRRVLDRLAIRLGIK